MSHNPQPPLAIRSRQRGPQDPGHQQPPRSTEPGKPTTGTTTHPPRRLQRKPSDRAPISIGQRTPGNQGQQPTDPARPQPPRHGRYAGPRPQEPELPQTPWQRPHPIPESARRPRQPSTVGVKTCPEVGEASSSGFTGAGGLQSAAKGTTYVAPSITPHRTHTPPKPYVC